MKYLMILTLALASPLQAANSLSIAKGFEKPDQTITWHSWKDEPEFRVRTGDRYLGHTRWEHYLGFEERRSSNKEIKILMIHLAQNSAPEISLAPGMRYGIVEITNSTMTAHKGYWSWIAQDAPFSRTGHSLLAPLDY